MIALYAIRTDAIGPPRFAGIIPGSMAWKVNAAGAALPFLRPWYNINHGNFKEQTGEKRYDRKQQMF